VVICDAPENQTGPRIVKLSDGNFIILWVDERRGYVPGFSWKYKDIYGQKLNSAGEIQWAENGISIVEGYVGVTYELQTDVRAVSDGEGGVIFSWTDAAGGGIQNNNVRINRLDGSGNKLWGEGGILLQDEIVVVMKGYVLMEKEEFLLYGNMVGIDYGIQEGKHLI